MQMGSAHRRLFKIKKFFSDSLTLALLLTNLMIFVVPPEEADEVFDALDAVVVRVVLHLIE